MERIKGNEADLGTGDDANTKSPSRLLMQATEDLLSHPWITAFDAVADSAAYVVGGVILRTLVPGGREPRDLDVQYEGPESGAIVLQERLRALGVPANVRSLETPGVRDMMAWATGWRRVKYQAGVLEMDPLAVLFVETRCAVIVQGLPDSEISEKTAAWVLKEYPGATIKRQ